MKSPTLDEIRLSQRSQWSEGQPISDLMARALANPELISLAAGFVDQATLPVNLVRDAATELFGNDAEGRSALQYGSTHGDATLRNAILNRLRDQDGREYADLDIDRVILTAGSNQMLHLIAETLLNAGDIVLCSSPTYLVFLGVLQGVGARSLGVLTDEEGIVPSALEANLQQLDQAGQLDRVKAIYLVSYYDNPTGISTSLERREQLVRIAQRWSAAHKIYVIEDTAYRELRYGRGDEPSARSFDESGDTVIATGSFSKSFSPGMRIGWGILPEELVEPVSNQKGNIDFGSPHVNQRLMAKVIASGGYDEHIRSLRRGYSLKMEAMLEAAQRYLLPIEGVRWLEPSGGLYVWATLPESLDTGPTGRLFDAAVREGVLYVPGQFCFPGEGQPVGRSSMRLSFGVQTPGNIRQGIEALSRAILQTIGSAG